EKCIKKEPSSKYNIYSNDQKSLFLYCLRLKLMSAAAAGRHARIVERTAQKWAKRLREDPDWDIYEKETNKFNRKPSQLQAEHKYHLINFFDEHPQARKEDAVESLTKAFEGLNLKKSSVGSFILNECNLTVKRVTRHPEGRNTPGRIEERRLWVEKWIQTDMDYLANCVFVDEAGFNINMRGPTARSAKGTPAVVVTPTTRAISHTILGAVSASGVVNLEVRVPIAPKRVKVDGARKRKKEGTKEMSKGTVTGHYMRFIYK
ncbi:hypothetical protein EDC94DRAFT_495331, partial [Helicostylum pulchrum]